MASKMHVANSFEGLSDLSRLIDAEAFTFSGRGKVFPSLDHTSIL
jgi:hypothetical protein